MQKIEEKELKNVNGGVNAETVLYCNCGRSYFAKEAAASREVEDGCSSYYEFKCPSCGKWNRA